MSSQPHVSFFGDPVAGHRVLRFTYTLVMASTVIGGPDDHGVSFTAATTDVVQVFVNGVLMQTTDYGLSGDPFALVTFDDPLPPDAVVEIVVLEGVGGFGVDDGSGTPPGSIIEFKPIYERTPVEIQAAVLPTNYSFPPYDIRRYGTVDTSGVISCLPAINAAIKVAQTPGGYNSTISVPHGTLLVDGTVTMHQGIMLAAPGSRGNAVGWGCTILHASNGDCFVWDGNGTTGASSGGGLKNLQIVKKSGFAGGVAIKLIATDDNHRPEDMVFENGRAVGESTATWFQCINIDGTGSPSYGIRSIVFSQWRVSDASAALQTVMLNNVAFIHARGLGIDQGHGAANPAVSIRGISSNLFFTGAALGGYMSIIANDVNNQCSNFIFNGKCTSGLSCADTLVDGVFVASGCTTNVNKSPFLKMMTNINPYVRAKITTSIVNVTGDATNFDVPWDTEQTDTDSSFVSPLWTCKVAGDYYISVSLLLQGLLAAHNRVDMYITRAGSANEPIATVLNPFAMAASQYATLHMSHTLRMAYGDTVKIQCNVQGGTKVVGFLGSAGTDYNKLTIRYVP